MNCQWESATNGAVCLNGCGRKPLTHDYPKPPIRECKKPPAPCRHLGPQTRIESIDCRECSKPKVKEFPVHHCTIYGECLPSYRGERMLNADGRALPKSCAECMRNGEGYQPSHSHSPSSSAPTRAVTNDQK